ncbi:MAG TPA: DUF1501 domain-containing protein [Acidobacteriota bacterium]|nr:DUF1501 domain-containing protein [Acidobacteriota bacterium]
MERCDCSRRDILKFTIRGGLALSFSQVLGVSTLFAGSAAKAKSCIVLWMAGGPSQIDTFDPKPGTSTGGEFKAISTAVSGIQISEHLPQVAKEMNDLAIIRSMTSKEGNHDRARYYVHTGYVPAGVTQHPSFGSVVAKELINKSQGLPAYVSINGPAAGAGLLGVNFAPFVVRDAEKPPENLSYAGHVTKDRFENRMKLLDAVNSQFRSNHQQEQLAKKEAIYQRAIDLMNSPSLTAFDVEKEPSTVRDRYGRTKTGAAFLMARRLIENGVKFVEVEMSGWDTHSDNFTETSTLMKELDPAYASLICDLRERGLLESTLVVWMGEFGRTPKINAKAGRDHWPQNWCAVLAGGGIRGGQVVGATDQTGMSIEYRPVTVPDLYSTLCHCLGIDDTKYNSSPLGRPIRIVDKGQVVTELI